MKNPSLLKALSKHDQAWLTATFARNRARFGDLRMEAEPDRGEGGGNDPAADPPEQKPAGEKPFAEMTADEKVEFLTAKNRRLEDKVRGKSKDPDQDVRALQRRIKELEPLAETVKALEEASQTEAEKAVRKALADGEKAGRDAALTEARKTYGSQLAGVKLDAAAPAKGLTPEQIREAAGDLSRFLDDDGVDEDALTRFLSALPDKADQVKPPRPDLGGGRREAAKVTGVQAGRELYAQMHQKKKTASA